MSTKGRKRNIVLNEKPKKEQFFSTETLENFQVNTGASLKHMKELTNFLRSNTSVLLYFYQILYFSALYLTIYLSILLDLSVGKNLYLHIMQNTPLQDLKI